MSTASPMADDDGWRTDTVWSAAHRAALPDLVAESFAAAAEVAGTPVEREFELGGARIRFRATDTGLLRRLTRTFTHLHVPTIGEPDLTIHLWDSASTATPPPPTPDVHGEQLPGAFFYYSEGPVRAGYQLGTSGDARVLAVYPETPTPMLSVLDNSTSTAWCWVADASRIPYWEEANSVRYLLDWFLRDRRVHVLHAASVGTTQGGVLLVGKSGSGKSTAAFSVLDSALQYAGDDYVAVSFDPEPTVHSLYSAGKLMPDHVARLPFLLPALDNADRLDVEKAVVYVHEHWPEAIVDRYPLRAILVPRVVDGAVEARLAKAPPPVGLSALAPSTVFQMHTRGQDSLARMRRLAESVPTYVLEVGSDISSIPVAISALLAEADEGAGA